MVLFLVVLFVFVELLVFVLLFVALKMTGAEYPPPPPQLIDAMIDVGIGVEVTWIVPK